MRLPPLPLFDLANCDVKDLASFSVSRNKIRVNFVHPGFIWTPLVEKLGNELPGGAAAFRKLLGSEHPIGQVGEPDDIGWGIVYLASDESKFVTGSELIIDGGYTVQ